MLSTKVVTASSGRFTAFKAHVSARPARSASVRAMASLKIYVKGDPATKTLLDCPFCHRVLLTAEVKHIPYTKEYIDFDHKPEW